MPDTISDKRTPELKSFKPISEKEIVDIVQQLSNKSSALDAIPFSLFKECLPELLFILLLMSLLEQVPFPQILKLQRLDLV